MKHTTNIHAFPLTLIVIAECKSTPLAEGTLYFSVVSIDWIRLKIPEGSDADLNSAEAVKRETSYLLIIHHYPSSFAL